jgi:hypothetical protein
LTSILVALLLLILTVVLLRVSTIARLTAIHGIWVVRALLRRLLLLLASRNERGSLSGPKFVCPRVEVWRRS